MYGTYSARARGARDPHTSTAHTQVHYQNDMSVMLIESAVRAISELPMQHFAVTDVYTPKLCPLVKFGVITCPLCGPVGPGVTSRVLALTETDIEPLLEIRWS